MGADAALVAEIRAGLAQAGDPARAEQQQRYMKSAMPYRGAGVPQTRKLAGAALRRHPLADADTWQATILALWDEAAYREERYAALALARHARNRPWAARLASLRLYERLIRSGAWWDLVDETSHCVGAVRLAYPLEAGAVLRNWAHDEDLWVRRASIICQLQHKDATDLDLLTHCIEANIADADFFARKAIGWALRDYAKTEPGWVREFVAAHPDLSTLSRREALKNVG